MYAHGWKQIHVQNLYIYKLYQHDTCRKREMCNVSVHIKDIDELEHADDDLLSTTSSYNDLFTYKTFCSIIH